MSKKLKQTGIYRDGGSRSYKDEDGASYFIHFTFNKDGSNHYKKLYAGNINYKPLVLADGEFVIESDLGEIKIKQ